MLQNPKQAYLAAVNAFRIRYPRVTRYSAWNEPNLDSEPFRGLSTEPFGIPRARQAGKMFNVLWEACSSPLKNSAGTVIAPKCMVIAGDFSEAGLGKSYLTEYKRGAGLRGKSHQWATHPYNTMHDRQRSGAYTAFLRATRGPVWLTESGAFYQRYSKVPQGSPQDESGLGQDFVTGYEPNTTRQFNRIKWALDTLIPWRYNSQPSRVTHFYYYQWADDGESWGTGLFRTASTTTRPSSQRGAGTPYCLYRYRNLTANNRNNRCS